MFIVAVSESTENVFIDNHVRQLPLPNVYVQFRSLECGMGVKITVPKVRQSSSKQWLDSDGASLSTVTFRHNGEMRCVAGLCNVPTDPTMQTQMAARVTSTLEDMMARDIHHIVLIACLHEPVTSPVESILHAGTVTQRNAGFQLLPYGVYNPRHQFESSTELLGYATHDEQTRRITVA